MSIDKKVSDFMSAFISSPEPEIDHEYFQIEEEYSKMYGHTVPREMLPDSVTTDSIKAAMKKCIESGKDTLFELLGVEINNDYLY